MAFHGDDGLGILWPNLGQQLEQGQHVHLTAGTRSHARRRTHGNVDEGPGEAVLEARERVRPLAGVDRGRIQQALRGILPCQPPPVLSAQWARVSALRAHLHIFSVRS